MPAKRASKRRGKPPALAQRSTSGKPARKPVGGNGLPGAQLRTEIDQLRRRVRQMEKARQRDQQTITTLEAARDAYRRSLYAWAKTQVSEEDLRRWADEEDEGVTLDEFIEELEKIVKGK